MVAVRIHSVLFMLFLVVLFMGTSDARATKGYRRNGTHALDEPHLGFRQMEEIVVDKGNKGAKGDDQTTTDDDGVTNGDDVTNDDDVANDDDVTNNDDQIQCELAQSR